MSGAGSAGDGRAEGVDLDRAAMPFITIDEGGKFVLGEECLRYVRAPGAFLPCVFRWG